MIVFLFLFLFLFSPIIEVLYFMWPLCHYCGRTSMISFGKFWKVVVGVDLTVPGLRATVYCKAINCKVCFVTLLTKCSPNSLSWQCQNNTAVFVLLILKHEGSLQQLCCFPPKQDLRDFLNLLILILSLRSTRA